MTKEILEVPTEGAIKSKAGRPPRKPIQAKGKLGEVHIPGYYLRYINTDEQHHANRLQDCKDAWYEPVLRKEIFGADCDRPDDVHMINDASKPMLVKLPIELREEDLARKKKAADDQLGKALATNLGEYGGVKSTKTSGQF